jgi:phi13 family phage major tail protein
MAGNPKIGLDNVWVAPLLSGTDTDTIPPAYGTPVRLAGAVTATLNLNGTTTPDYGDNGAFFIGTTKGNTDMDLELIDIDPDVYAAMVGATRANGIHVMGALDQSPWYAMGFRVLLGGKDSSGNDIYEYFWLNKGKFAEAQQGSTTKKDTLSYGHTNLKALFAKLNYNNVSGVKGRTDYDLTTAQAAAWFNAPLYKTDANLSAVTVTGALSGGTAGNVVLTFDKADSSNFTIAEASAVIGSSIVIQVAGVAVAGATAWTDQGTDNPILTFTPTTPFSGVSILVAVTNSVKDTNGVTVTPYTVALTAA